MQFRLGVGGDVPEGVDAIEAARRLCERVEASGKMRRVAGGEKGEA